MAKMLAITTLHGTNTLMLKSSNYAFLSFPIYKYCYNVRYLFPNDAKALRNEVHAFGGEPCRLFQLALNAVF